MYSEQQGEPSMTRTRGHGKSAGMLLTATGRELVSDLDFDTNVPYCLFQELDLHIVIILMHRCASSAHSLMLQRRNNGK